MIALDKRIVLILLGLLVTINAYAQTINDNEAIKAILGEARGEGFDGMYAVACAIRNRGTLRGVYGLKASMGSIDAKTRQIASKAWYLSKDGEDVTKGASFWEGTKFKKPYWARNMVRTVRVGHQEFYKERI